MHLSQLLFDGVKELIFLQDVVSWQLLKIKLLKIMVSLNDINNILKFYGKTAIVLGSGLDLSSIELDRKRSLKYDIIKSMPVSSVIGHKSEFISGYYNREQILIS